jgi:hypothetical protein
MRNTFVLVPSTSSFTERPILYVTGLITSDCGWAGFIRRVTSKSLPALSGALAALCLATNGNAEPLSNQWSSDSLIITMHIKNKQCGDAWDIIWKHALSGNKKAFQGAAGAIGFQGLRLPGAPTDGLFMLRLATAFSVHGYDESDAVNSFSKMYFQELASLLFGEIIPACRKQYFEFDSCFNEVRSKNLVPSSEALMREISGFQSTSGTKAFCETK